MRAARLARIVLAAVILAVGGRRRSGAARSLYQAINQLEAMQSRRNGAPAALRRVQAFGLPGG